MNYKEVCPPITMEQAEEEEAARHLTTGLGELHLSASASASAGSFSVGERVVMFGLSAEKYNGLEGDVEGPGHHRRLLTVRIRCAKCCVWRVWPRLWATQIWIENRVCVRFQNCPSGSGVGK